MVKLAAESATAAKARASSIRLRIWVRNRIATVLVGVAALCLAEILSRNGIVSNLILPAPSDVVVAFYEGWTSGLYWPHFISTVASALGGFVIAAILALGIAIILMSISFLEQVITPYIVALQAIPKITLAPLAMLWLGFGISSKLAVVVTSCFFPICINAMQGLRLRDQDSYDLLRALGASRWQMARLLRLPGAVPYVFAGFHVGMVLSLIGAVTAEFVGSQSGLGVLLLQQRAAFDLAGVFAVIFLLMLIGVAFHQGTTWLERRAAFWGREVTTVVTP